MQKPTKHQTSVEINPVQLPLPLRLPTSSPPQPPPPPRAITKPGKTKRTTPEGSSSCLVSPLKASTVQPPTTPSTTAKMREKPQLPESPPMMAPTAMPPHPLLQPEAVTKPGHDKTDKPQTPTARIPSSLITPSEHTSQTPSIPPATAKPTRKPPPPTPTKQDL